MNGMHGISGHHPTIIPYDTNATILPAAQLLVQASNQNKALRDVPEFRVDVVEVTRQLLANRFIGLYTSLVSTFNSSSATANDIAAAGQPLLDILDDLETLLATNENYLLSSWIADATAWSHGNASYASYLEYNARNQLTLWGPDGEINDYASKQWSGIVGTYYAARWQTFVSYLVELKNSGAAYNSTLLTANLLAIGQTWDRQTFGQRASETNTTVGDTFAVVNTLLKRWA